MSAFETTRQGFLKDRLTYHRALNWLGYCCHCELGRQRADDNAHDAVSQLGLYLRVGIKKSADPFLSVRSIRRFTRDYLNELPEYHAMLELLYEYGLFMGRQQNRTKLKKRANELARASLNGELVLMPPKSKAAAPPMVREYAGKFRQAKKDNGHRDMMKLLEILNDTQKAALRDLLENL